MKLESSCVNSECDVYDSCDKFSEQSEYKYCPGIYEAMYKECYKIIHFDLKSLRHSTTPLAC